MENDKNHIGDLYQKAFSDAGWDDPEDEQDWNAIAFELDKKRFYRFSWTRFNVYYCGFIILLVLLMVFLLARYLMLEENTFKKNNPTHPDSGNVSLIERTEG